MLSMTYFEKALPLSSLGEGETKKVFIKNNEIALRKVGGTIFAFDDTCTHEYCSLSDGNLVSGFEITCPCHGAIFDIRDGEPVALPAARPLRTYRTKVEGKSIYVELPE